MNAAKLGTVKRAHGALQVTYAGKPLYRFFEDMPGQVNGKHHWDVGASGPSVATVPATPAKYRLKDPVDQRPVPEGLGL